MFKVEQTAGGSKNVTLQITGVATEGDIPLTEIPSKAKNLRLESIVWVVQEKLGVLLQWKYDELFLVMESRNSIRFDAGIHSPPEWNGSLWLGTTGFSNPAPFPKQFLIVLDFDK